MSQALNIRAIESVFDRSRGEGEHVPSHRASTHTIRAGSDDEAFMLFTGATGFVGNVLLAELLKRGHRCLVLIRPPKQDRQTKLVESLTIQGIDAQRLIQTGHLRTLGGSLPDGLPQTIPQKISRVIHVAGSTRFNPDPGGEPSRTNDEGTRQLLRWMDTHEIYEIHHVSTAYVFGQSQVHAPESVPATPPNFRNVYERSKWEGERHVWRWGQRPSNRWTIYRPSIVVGDSQTGRATRFGGPYLAFRFLDALGRSSHIHPDRPFRIGGSPDANLNMIPVDYVAELIASIIEHPRSQARVYNLVHPDPISTKALLAMFEGLFGVPCDHFEEMDNPEQSGCTPAEKKFITATRHLHAYLDQPTYFERGNTARVEKMMSRSCPTWDEPAIHRLIQYARKQDWGRTP